MSVGSRGCTSHVKAHATCSPAKHGHMWHEQIPNMNSRTQEWFPKVGPAVLRPDNPFSAGLSGLSFSWVGRIWKHLLFDGTGPSKTLTTLGINKQENKNKQTNSKHNARIPLQCKKEEHQKICFRKAVSFGIEDARLGSVCCCVSEITFLIFLFIYPKGG